MSLRILLAAGGTGGHVYPAIAIADAIRMRRPDADIRFAGTRNHMEWQAVPKAGYPIHAVTVSGMIRRLTWRNLSFPFKLMLGMAQSAKLVWGFRPHAVIACGGYVAGPVGWMGAKVGVPLFVQEQNSYPGVTNRMLAKHARVVYTAFADAAVHLSAREIRMTGNPVRGHLSTPSKTEAYARFGFDTGRRTLLVMGGSGGAKTLNDALREALPALHDTAGLNLVWPCGPRYYETIRRDTDLGRYPHLRLVPYLDDIAPAYAAADLVVSRAGAGTIAELTTLAKPMILVPSPNVAGDHQRHNAESVAHAGAAELLTDAECVHELAPTVLRLLDDPYTLNRMADAARALGRPDAAATIAEDILDRISA